MKIYNVVKVPQGLGYDDVDYEALYQSGYTAGYASGYTDGQEDCPGPIIEKPLTFEILSDGILYWKVESYLSATVATIEYSKDSGNTWVSVSSTLEGTPISVYSGEIIQFRGFSSAGTYGSTFSGSTPEFRVYGNIMSLIYGDDFRGQTVLPDTGRGRSFGRLFQFCTGLTDAQELKLPATSLVTDCYSFMFWGDTSLVTPPELPATDLIRECYLGMFSGCTSLSTAPELPATTLAIECYGGMFAGCSSLTTAPDLPAEMLVHLCYNSMFRGCSSLNYIKCLARRYDSGNSQTLNWVKGVAENGTFVKKGLRWQTGDSGIPNNWTVIKV